MAVENESLNEIYSSIQACGGPTKWAGGQGPPWLAIVPLKNHVIMQSKNSVIYCTGRQSRGGVGFIENVFLLVTGDLEYIKNKIQV